MSEGIGNILPPLVALSVRASAGSNGADGRASNEASAAVVGSEPPPPEERAPTRPGQDTRSTEELVDMAELNQVVESINSYLQATRRALEFSVDDSSGRTVITVMDGDREQVIRQIPPEAVLALAEQIQEEQDVRGTGLADKA